MARPVCIRYGPVPAERSARGRPGLAEGPVDTRRMPSTEPHASTSAPPAGDARHPAPARADLPVLRVLDVVLVLLSAPVAILLGAPAAGVLLAAGAWAIQRVGQEVAAKRAVDAGDARRAAGIIGGSMLVRVWFVIVVIVVCGVAIGDRDGAAAAVLVLAAFSVHLGITLVVREPTGSPSA